MKDRRRAYDDAFLSDCARIHQQWHERAKSRDTEGLLALYARDAVLETPLVQAIFDDRESGVLHGHQEIRPFFEEGARRRPNALVRWHRRGKWLTDGERLLIWEYPRQAPDGDQVDLVEVMEIADGLIQHHRIYWGWFGTALLTRSAVRRKERVQGRNNPSTSEFRGKCLRGLSIADRAGQLKKGLTAQQLGRLPKVGLSSPDEPPVMGKDPQAMFFGNTRAPSITRTGKWIRGRRAHGRTHRY